MIWFTSDQHFGHANIIKYCNRPFSFVEEMDEVMIQRWNKVVKSSDWVYHLGDFTLGSDVYKYYSRLNGEIIFIAPDFHHDQRWIELSGESLGVKSVLCANIHDTWVFMFHYPVLVWDRKHYGAWHLYGHIHDKRFVLPGFSMNVGVDHHGFYPVSFDEIEQYMINMGWHEGWKEFE